MSENMNLEFAHKLTEHEHQTGERRRWEEAIQILGVAILALAAVAGGWGGYQAAKGHGKQSILYSEASVHRVQANQAATSGQQRLAADADIFTRWLQASTLKDAHLQAMLVRRFSPEYRAAFTAWLATGPFTNPDAPPGPGYLPEYHNPQVEQAAHLNEQAAVKEEQGTHARETAEQYVRMTVLFALVLFLVAMSQRFRVFGVRVTMIVMALGLLGYGIYDLATLPRL
jgi:hypothetical protein